MMRGGLSEEAIPDLLTELRKMAQTFGGVQAEAEQAHLNPDQRCRTLSSQAA